jgi:hypothetical protein
MAERAESQEKRSFLVDLAHAWMLLGEQLNHSHLENDSDPSTKVR